MSSKNDKMIDLGVYEYKDKYYRVSVSKKVAEACEQKGYKFYNPPVVTHQDLALKILSCPYPLFFDKSSQLVEQIPTPRKAFRVEKAPQRNIEALRAAAKGEGIYKPRTDDDVLREKFGQAEVPEKYQATKELDVSPVQPLFPLYIKQVSHLDKSKVESLVILDSEKDGTAYWTSGITKSSKIIATIGTTLVSSWLKSAKEETLCYSFISRTEFEELCKEYNVDYKPF